MTPLRAYPVFCLLCDGEGGYLVQSCDHVRGNCPCGTQVEVECPGCRCSWCGESGADRVTDDGERLHTGCLPEWVRMVDGPVLWDPAYAVAALDDAGPRGLSPAQPALYAGSSRPSLDRSQP